MYMGKMEVASGRRPRGLADLDARLDDYDQMKKSSRLLSREK